MRKRPATVRFFLLRSPAGEYLAADHSTRDPGTVPDVLDAAHFLSPGIVETYWPHLLEAGWQIEPVDVPR